MHVITHDTPAMNCQTTLSLTKPDVFQQNISILLSGKYIYPLNYRKGDKMNSGLVPDFIATFRHRANLTGQVKITYCPELQTPDTELWLFLSCPAVKYGACGGVRGISAAFSCLLLFHEA
jgi:hypothetical protein